MTETPGADHGGRPDPGAAVTVGEFVDALVRLKRWSGLGYRQLAKRATVLGHALPRSTLTVALNRNTLPREDLVVALASTCGCDEEEVARWVGARRRIAAAGPDRPGPRWLGHRHLPVPGARGRRDPAHDEEVEDAASLELVVRELAERHARRRAVRAALESRSLLLAGSVAAAALHLAAHPAGAVLRAFALAGYALAFLAAVAVPAIGAPGEEPGELVEEHARRPTAQVLTALAAAHLAALQADTRRHRRRARCWWAALTTAAVATALAVLALL